MSFCAILLLTALFVAPAVADWPQFRGTNGAGVAAEAVPVEFGPDRNELWSVPLAPGHSSPCVVDDSIFLTTFDGPARNLNVLRIARKDGSVVWSREVHVDRVETGHPSFNPASSTPACDGERVVAYFGSFGLICFDVGGDKLWEVKLPLAKSYGGNATSPAIIGDKVILYRGNHVDHFLLALDKKTGDELWRVRQDEPFTSELACTSFPIVAGNKLIVHTARSVQAFDVETGKLIWVTKCATTATSTPVLAGSEVIVAAWNKMGEPALRPSFPTFDDLVGSHDKDKDNLISRDELPRLMIFHRPDGAEAPQNGAALHFSRADRDRDGEISAEEWGRQLADIARFREGYKKHGLLAIPIDSKGVVGKEGVRTLATQAIPEVPSPLVHGGIVYCVKNGGVLSSVEISTGKLLSRVRTRGKGTHYASPVIIGDKLYSTAGDGTITVLTLGATPKILAVNKMGGRTYATPAASDGVLYVRTHAKLFAFRKAEG